MNKAAVASGVLGLAVGVAIGYLITPLSASGDETILMAGGSLDIIAGQDTDHHYSFDKDDTVPTNLAHQTDHMKTKNRYVKSIDVWYATNNTPPTSANETLKDLSKTQPTTVKYGYCPSANTCTYPMADDIVTLQSRDPATKAPSITISSGGDMSKDPHATDFDWSHLPVRSHVYWAQIDAFDKNDNPIHKQYTCAPDAVNPVQCSVVVYLH